MTAMADTRAGSTDPAKLTVLYTRNDDGWITAQIAEFPAAISQGRTEHEAWTNVLDALHDLTHEPTASERIAAVVQARLIEPLSGLIEPLDGRLHGLASRARARGRQHVSLSEPKTLRALAATARRTLRKTRRQPRQTREGRTASVPRHREIARGTVIAICGQLEVPMPPR
jgi:predicted RNase H-like HicB family nuclease